MTLAQGEFFALWYTIMAVFMAVRYISDTHKTTTPLILVMSSLALLVIGPILYVYFMTEGIYLRCKRHGRRRQ